MTRAKYHPPSFSLVLDELKSKGGLLQTGSLTRREIQGEDSLILQPAILSTITTQGNAGRVVDSDDTETGLGDSDASPFHLDSLFSFALVEWFVQLNSGRSRPRQRRWLGRSEPALALPCTVDP
jgi:hypothetical protein